MISIVPLRGRSTDFCQLDETNWAYFVDFRLAVVTHIVVLSRKSVHFVELVRVAAQLVVIRIILIRDTLYKVGAEDAVRQDDSVDVLVILDALLV